jgi:hypothetical protein
MGVGIVTVVDFEGPQLPALRISDLKRIGQSPAHYKAAIDSTASHLDKGSAVHAALLGGKRVCYFDRQTESGKQAPRSGKFWEQFQADNPDALILTRDEYFQTNGMVEAVRACPEAMRVLDGAKETTLRWDVQGRACRGTPDVLCDQYVTELKTTRSSDPRRFMWDAIKLGYFAQLAWYMDGALKAGAATPDAAFVVAVESAAPYVVTVFRATERALEMGRRTYRSWFERLLNCEASDEWPGYVQSVVDLDVPDRDGEAFAEEAA